MSFDEYNLNRYYIEGKDEYMEFIVYWLRLLQSDTQSLQTTPGIHSFYELQYVLNGSIIMTVNEKRVSLSEGEYILIFPDTAHEIQSFGEHTEKLVFGFSVNFGDGENIYDNTGLQLTPRKETPVLRSIAELLIKLSNSGKNNTLSAVQIRRITEAFIIELFSLTVPHSICEKITCIKSDKNYKIETIELMTEHIEKCTSDGGVSVERLAEHFHMSKRHLSRLCGSTVGKTPYQLIKEEQLKYLRDVLMTTDTPLYEIAENMGFSSANTLARFFQRNEGYTPAQYRKYTTQK